jgi:predicted aspartyl protease
MNIRYRSVPDLTRPEGYQLAPLLQVFLRRDVNMRPFLALVDSGASDCIFPESAGVLLGLDVRSGRPLTFYGLARQEAPGFAHSVQLQVQDLIIG